MGTELEKYATVQEIADRLGVSEQAIRRALKVKRIAGFKMGKIWIIPIKQFDGHPGKNGKNQ